MIRENFGIFQYFLSSCHIFKRLLNNNYIYREWLNAPSISCQELPCNIEPFRVHSFLYLLMVLNEFWLGKYFSLIGWGKAYRIHLIWNLDKYNSFLRSLVANTLLTFIQFPIHRYYYFVISYCILHIQRRYWHECIFMGRFFSILNVSVFHSV